MNVPRYFNIFKTGTELIKPGIHVVKIQIEVNTGAKMMVYNQDRTIFFERPLTAAVKKFMSGGLKRYATINMDNGGGFSIIAPHPKKEW